MNVSALLLFLVLAYQSAQDWYTTGVQLAASGKSPEAIEAYRKAVAIDPRFVDAWNNLGDLLRRTGDIDGAWSAIRQALAINPDHPRATLNGALIQIELKHFRDAIPLLQSARKAMGNQPALDYLDARVYLELKEYDAALPFLTRFRQAGAVSPSGSFELSRLLMAQEHYSDVAEMLAAVQPEQRNVEIELVLGQAWYALDRMEQARDSFAVAIRKAPEDYRGHLWAGFATRALGDAVGAEKVLREALRLKPESIDALLALADLDLDQDQPERSLQEADKALSLEHDSAAALLARGLALLRLQRVSEAIDSLAKIPAGSAEYDRALYPLSRAYRQAGDIEKSDRALHEFQSRSSAADPPAMPVRPRP